IPIPPIPNGIGIGSIGIVTSLILLLVDIVSLCYSSEIDEISVRQLEDVILHHNDLVRKLYSNTLKQKYHFLLHLPREMALFGLLKDT
ncbi:unnamed protein product, partial [Didymodactylos carnosus]